MNLIPLTHLSNKAQIGVDEPAPFKLLNPKTVEEAVRMLSDHGPEAVVLAGGCDILEKIKTQWIRPKYLVNIKTIDYKLEGGHHDMDPAPLDPRIKLSQLQSLNNIPNALKQAAERVASPQIRNMGTLGGNILQDSRCPYYRGPWNCYRAGGNICDAVRGYTFEHALWGGERCYTVSPSDCAVALVALDAFISIRGPEKSRDLKVAELFAQPSYDITKMHKLAPNEILTYISCLDSYGPMIHHKLFSSFRKAAQRNVWDFALASCAIAAHMEGDRVSSIRIVLGAVAPTPHRTLEAEKLLVGTNLKDHIEDVVLASVAGAEPLPHNHYKIGLVKNLVRECLEDIVQQNKS